jgi:hypothetical protein
MTLTLNINVYIIKQFPNQGKILLTPFIAGKITNIEKGGGI